MPHETNGVNNAVSCYKETVQFSVFFVTSLFAVFDEICGTAMNFVFLIIRVRLINIANIPLDRSTALVLSVINRTYFSCTGICQIWLEIWPEPDLARFPKNG